MTRQVIQKMDDPQVINLMCEVVDLSEGSEEIVLKIIKDIGFQGFFKSLELLMLNEEERERMLALKEVIKNRAKVLERGKSDDK